MNVCIFFHRFDGGGAERTTVCLANELRKRGHHVEIAVRYNYGPSKELLDKNIPVLDMKIPEKGKLRKNVKNIQKLIRIMNSGKYDLVMAVMSEMAQVAAIAYAFSGKNTPLICVLHNTMSVEKTSFRIVRRSLFRFFDRQYSQVVAVSEAVRLDYLRCCDAASEKVTTVYNPVVGEELFTQMRETIVHPWLGKNRSCYTLLLAGRLSPQKNHALMFRTLLKLRSYGDFRLILLGEGELEDKLREQVKRLGLKEWVDFAGYVSNPYAYMAACDCLVLSSEYEGLPTVLIEALACGCRIVSVDCPSGPREILNGGEFGILVKMDDAEALKEGILKAVQQVPDYERLRQRAMDFSIENAGLGYENVFNKAMRYGRRE